MIIKKYIKQCALIVLIATIVLLSGCASKADRYELIKAALKDKYNDEFIVRSIDDSAYSGSEYVAFVSPVNVPDCMFEIIMDGDTLVEDRYIQSRTEYVMYNRLLAYDLHRLFPSSYFKVNVSMTPKNNISKVRDASLMSLVADAKKADYSHVHIDIYYEEDTIDTEQYEQEYLYFTDTINDYINKGYMFPLSVSFYRIDDSQKQKIIGYYLEDTRKNKRFYDTVFGKDVYVEGVRTNEDTEVGTPPNITVYFSDDTPDKVDDMDEYIRRRTLLDSAQ